MEHLKTIRLTRPQGANYTPASLMHSYAAEHPGARFSSYRGRAVLTIDGTPYGYDHWEIRPAAGEEIVTVYLFPCGSLMKGASQQ